jgi:hypothetical protein
MADDRNAAPAAAGSVFRGGSLVTPDSLGHAGLAASPAAAAT